MVDQAQMNGRFSNQREGRSTDSASPLKVARHAVELTELQFQLLLTDLRSGAPHLRSGVIAMMVAAPLLIATLPVLLMALAAFLETQFDWSRALSLLAAFAVGGVAGFGLLAFGWWSLRRAASKLQRSADEMRQNLHWAKQLISDQSDPDGTPSKFRVS